MIASIAVIIATTLTIRLTPAETTILLPEPRSSISGSSSMVGLASVPAPNNGSSMGGAVGDGIGISLIVQNLEAPMAMDVSKDGRIFLAEKMGTIMAITPSNGHLVDHSILNIGAAHLGEEGLLGLALSPNFTEDHLMYAYYTYANGNTIFNRVIMLKEIADKVVDSKVIIDAIPAAEFNNGGRIKFGPDNKLYVSTGDAMMPNLAQDLDSLAGKILRINPDGTIPGNNPLSGSPVYAYGFQNVQGLAWHPRTNLLYALDESRSGNDEINIINPGGNYGWPIKECALGSSFSSTSRTIGSGSSNNTNTAKSQHGSSKLEDPAICFSPALEPGGSTFAASNRLGYQNHLIIASLRGYLREINLDSNTQSTILEGYGRLRDIIETSDGSLLVATSNKDGFSIPGPNDDKILRIR
ncbi:MAG TPA: PQQ-dependent sugar dehydrogenase [Candidatus Nitrosopolaris sp.]|nr:PQQ-dependent sugar dehydrogenase [Candidatus Nitrosopolaris sp.]